MELIFPITESGAVKPSVAKSFRWLGGSALRLPSWGPGPLRKGLPHNLTPLARRDGISLMEKSRSLFWTDDKMRR